MTHEIDNIRRMLRIHAASVVTVERGHIETLYRNYDALMTELLALGPMLEDPERVIGNKVDVAMIAVRKAISFERDNPRKVLIEDERYVRERLDTAIGILEEKLDKPSETRRMALSNLRLAKDRLP